MCLLSFTVYLTQHKYPCRRRDSNLQSQQAIGRRRALDRSATGTSSTYILHYKNNHCNYYAMFSPAFPNPSSIQETLKPLPSKTFIGQKPKKHLQVHGDYSSIANRREKLPRYSELYLEHSRCFKIFINLFHDFSQKP